MESPFRKSWSTKSLLFLWVQGEWRCKLKISSWGELTSPATTQAQNQSYGVLHLNIHSICDLLEHVKGQVLQTPSCRISMTQGNDRITKRGPCVGPALTVWQKPEALSQTMTLCNAHLQIKINGQKGLLHDLLCHTTVSMRRCFSFFSLILLGGLLQG